MAADYDRLFQLPEGAETPDKAAAETDYHANPLSPTSPMSTSRPKRNGRARPSMPVDSTEPPPPTSLKPPPPPMPVDWPQHSSPARPAPPPASPGPRTQGPAHHAKHPRRSHRGPADPQSNPPATPQSSHRARSQPGPRKSGGPAMPVAPTTGSAKPRKQREPNLSPSAAAASAATQHSADSASARNGRRPRPRAAAQPQTTSASSRDARHENLAVSDLGVKPVPKKSAARMVSQRGWRRRVHRLTRINFGLTRDEKYEIELHNRICRRVRGSYQIGVLGLKGGAGKTAVTVALGSAFAQVRGDRILAIDADSAAGNLADRVGRQSAATIADLLASKALSHYNDIRAHTSINAVNLEVLSAAEYRTAPRRLSAEEWRHAVAAVPRFYNLVLADCGADLFAAAARGVLATASGLVIVSSASIDSVRQAAVAIDWLRHTRYKALVNRACVVINDIGRAESNTAVDTAVHHFEQYVQCGRVIVLPWDKHIAVGTEIQLDALGDTYKRRIIELAAALSDDFDGSERR
jgi:MinD-like ATPase involved in chromosome partitioning or flagellar assembly